MSRKRVPKHRLERASARAGGQQSGAAATLQVSHPALHELARILARQMAAEHIRQMLAGSSD